MSNMQDDEFREDDIPDEVDDPEGGGEASQPEKKKASLPMMAAIGVGVAAVVGFAGLQVYNTLMPKPRQQSDVAPMAVQPLPAQAPQPVVPAPAAAPVLPADPNAMPVGAAPVAGAIAPVTPAAPAGVAVPATPAALPVGSEVQPVVAGAPAQAPALGATPAPLAPTGFAPSAGPVNMDAIAALKKSQESQGKQMEDISARLQRLEARLAELAGSGRSAKGQSVAEEDDDAKERKAALRKARLKKAKELAAKRAEERKRKAGSKDVKEAKAAKPADKPRAKNVVKSSEVLPDAPVPKRSVPVVDLPPAPVAETPAPKKPQAEEQSTVRITGLRIQAVIPGRVWIADEGGVARSYSVGDAVRAGVVIRSIDAEKGVVTTSAGLIR